MKKYIGAILPFLVLPFLVSCGGKNNASHRVTKEEYEHALMFEGVEYAQSKFIEKEADIENFVEVTEEEYSPTIFTTITFRRFNDDGEDELDSGKYVVKNENRYMVSEYDDATSKWSNPIEGEESDFDVASESLKVIANSIIINFPVIEEGKMRTLTYDDLKYAPNKNEYFASAELEESGKVVMSFDIHMEFDNKRIVKIKLNEEVIEDGETLSGWFEFVINYKNSTPVVPPVIK